MTFKNIAVLLLILVSFNCVSQGEANTWYFGDKSGLDFNTGAPIVINDGALVTDEGCAVISTAFGELQFYTDGISVFNKNHQIMPNGTGLAGNSSSSQSALILPKPGSASIYYIFTVTNLAGTAGMKYSEVDMTLNDGLGDVTEVKNFGVIAPVCEKLTAVRKKNGEGYWIITRGFTGLASDSGDKFFSFSFTSEGVDTNPVVSAVGTVIGGLLYRSMGYLKVSPNGKKIVSANYGLITEVFDFDRVTGMLSNPKLVSNNNNGYGVEFSISGQFLYLTTGDVTLNELHQYDLASSDIPNSVKKIYTTPEGKEIYALQMAPDFKIYAALAGTSYLGVINNPDVMGTGCNFVANAINMTPGLVKLGLPQFNQSYFYGSIFAENTCFGDNTLFNFESDIDATSIHWDFGDGHFSSEVTPTHVYASAGTYNVIVTAESEDGTIAKSKEIKIYAPPSFMDVLEDVKVCGNQGDSIDLEQYTNFFLGAFSASEYGIKYYTTLEGAELNLASIGNDLILNVGSNKVVVKFYVLENEDCAVYSEFNVNLFQIPVANQINNVNKCDDVSNDSKEFFNLLENNTQLLGTQNQSAFAISYHLNQADATNGVNDIVENVNFLNMVNPQEIHARIYNVFNEDCFDTTSFFINVNRLPVANQPQNLYACQDDNGVAYFNLDSTEPEILGSQTAADFTIAYYLSIPNAANNLEALPFTYETSLPNETIYAKVFNNANPVCFDIISFEIFSRAMPKLILDDIYVICDGQQFITIEVFDEFSTYLWSNGDTSSQTTIHEAGSYSLVVTKDYGDVICSVVKNFTVRNSSIAIINEIIVSDLNVTNNNIVVKAQGAGTYQYSLDGINYQESPVFENLVGGKYTVYVQDIFGCGIVNEDFFVLIYPKFFTPNGDGYNDFWRIRFSDLQEPEMVITIFDRYGRLIKKLFSEEEGWDGTLNGNALPSDDYWFSLTRQNGSVLKGHFSLKR